jgi:hypothetical protein
VLTGSTPQRNAHRYDIYLTAKDTHLNVMSSVQRVDLFTNNSLGTSARTAPVFYPGFPGATIYGNTYVFVNIKVRHPHADDTQVTAWTVATLPALWLDDDGRWRLMRQIKLCV